MLNHCSFPTNITYHLEYGLVCTDDPPSTEMGDSLLSCLSMAPVLAWERRNQLLSLSKPTRQL